MDQINNGKSLVSLKNGIIHKQYFYFSDEKVYHEYLIGRALNGISNFVNTIDISNDKLLLEFVPGIIMSGTDLTTDQKNSIYNQVKSALQEANDKIDFTHYDISRNNIIIKFTSQEYITRTNGDIFETHGVIPIIIDFEYSYSNISHRSYKRSFLNYDLVRLSEICNVDLEINIPDSVSLGYFCEEFNRLRLK